MKIERLSSGNYIVQIKEYKSSNYKYALWLRSEPGQTSSIRTCVIWLGDGVVGQKDLSPINIIYSNSPSFMTLSKSLLNISANTIINREQLIKIAKEYEFSVFNGGGNEWNCLDNRTSIEGKLIVIEGDSRHKQAFEPPKAE